MIAKPMLKPVSQLRLAMINRPLPADHAATRGAFAP
jgi:hypothetical protein